MEKLSSSDLTLKIRTLRAKFDLSDAELHELFSCQDELLARKELRIDEMERQLEKLNKTNSVTNAKVSQQPNTNTQNPKTPAATGKKPAPKKDKSQDRKRNLETRAEPTTNSGNTKKQTKRAESPTTDTAMQVTPADNVQESPNQNQPLLQPKAKKPPPIHLRTKDVWPELQYQLRHHGAELISAKNQHDSIQVQGESAEHFRAATCRLDALQVPYHTYALPEDKAIRAVIKGIPEGISCEEIKRELEEELSVISVTRLKSRANKSALPVVLLQVPRTR